MAGAMAPALWCDLRVMAADAFKGVPCRRWGVPLIDGGEILQPRRVGRGRAPGLILTGRRVDADEARAIGRSDHIAPSNGAVAASSTTSDSPAPPSRPHHGEGIALATPPRFAHGLAGWRNVDRGPSRKSRRVAATLILAGCAPGQGTRIDQPTRFASDTTGALGRGNAPFPLDVRGASPDGSSPDAVPAATLGPNGRRMAPSRPVLPGPRVVVALSVSGQPGLCTTGPALSDRAGAADRMVAWLAFSCGSEPVSTTRMNARGTRARPR